MNSHGRLYINGFSFGHFLNLEVWNSGQNFPTASPNSNSGNEIDHADGKFGLVNRTQACSDFKRKYYFAPGANE
jgi:hypothetical protein